jgi:hypothetical protein
LFSFVAAAQKQYANPAHDRVINPITRSPIDPQFAQTLAQRFAVAKISSGKPVDAGRNLRLRASICQLRKPIIEDIFPGATDIVANLDHMPIVTYKLHTGKREKTLYLSFASFALQAIANCASINMVKYSLRSLRRLGARRSEKGNDDQPIRRIARTSRRRCDSRMLPGRLRFAAPSIPSLSNEQAMQMELAVSHRKQKTTTKLIGTRIVCLRRPNVLCREEGFS